MRKDGPQSHLPKAGTPTMGGALILLAIIFSTLLWADLSSRYVWIVVLVTLAFGMIGWVDDYRKLVLQDPEGMPARWKFLSQSAVGLVAAFALYVIADAPAETALAYSLYQGSVDTARRQLRGAGLPRYRGHQQCGQPD